MCVVRMVVVFKQKTAYEMRISDWSSDVCSSDLCSAWALVHRSRASAGVPTTTAHAAAAARRRRNFMGFPRLLGGLTGRQAIGHHVVIGDRKSTRLNSSH